MKDGGKDIPRGLLAYAPNSKGNSITSAPPESWKKAEFHPLDGETGKDRFGNRMLYSPDFAYLDRQNNVMRAGLLLSKEGQALVKSMPGCLGQLDAAIEQISEAEHKEVEFEYGKLSDRLLSGGQSVVYIWELLNGQKYIIKVPKHEQQPEIHTRFDQPYIDEMLQTQELAENMLSYSDELRVNFNSFIFASSRVSCTEFVEGEHPTRLNVDVFDRLNDFVNGAQDYISRDSKDGVFRSVYIDPIKSKNVIVKPDGSIVWIDPFYSLGRFLN